MAHDLWLLRGRFETWKLLLGDEAWEEHFSDNLRELNERLYQLEADYLTLLEDAIAMHATIKERGTWVTITST